MNGIKFMFVEGSAKSPQIDLNHLSGELILAGRSIPENAAKIYEPIVNWISSYIKSPNPITNFRLSLEYFNTSSMLWVSRIVKLLCKINNHDYTLFIHLYFEKEDFNEMDAEDFKEILESLIGDISNVKVSIGIKAYGTEENGEIIKESLFFISEPILK